jgi:hypothetical protein
MPRATRGQTERPSVGTSTTQPDIEEVQHFAEGVDFLPNLNSKEFKILV